MAKDGLDTKDSKILMELDTNCRQPDSKISKKVGLSQQVVSYRIGRLVKSGIIRQFYTVVDVTKLGYSIYKICFKLQNMNEEKELEMKQFLLNNKNVLWAGSYDGAWDLGVTVLAKTAQELDKMLKEFASVFSPNILYKTALLIVDAPHFLRSYDGETTILNFSGGEDRLGLDSIDKRILSTMSTDARMPYFEIGENVGTGPDVVRYRLKKLMESGVIKGFRVWIDQNLAGKQFHKLLLSLQNATLEKEKMLLSFCKKNVNIAFALKTIGAWDMELEFHVKDNKEFHDNVLELRNAFQDIIRSYEPLLISEEYKFNYCDFL